MEGADRSRPLTCDMIQLTCDMIQEYHSLVSIAVYIGVNFTGDSRAVSARQSLPRVDEQAFETAGRGRSVGPVREDSRRTPQFLGQ